MRTAKKLVFEGITADIIGAFYEVYNELGYGFLESVYRRALIVSLNERSLFCQSELLLTISYHGVHVGDYKADLIVESKIVVETKSASAIHPAHELQLYNYLKASRLQVGLVLNFGPTAAYTRHVLSSALLRKNPINPLLSD